MPASSIAGAGPDELARVRAAYYLAIVAAVMRKRSAGTGHPGPTAT